jgi:homoprotocatechuate degradation regulator HpaR
MLICAMSRIRRFSESLPMLLLRARETAMSHFRPILKAHGVTEQQWRALRVLHQAGELTATGLAAECAILAPSMTRIIRHLSAKRLILSRRSRNDRRELKLRISAKGKRLVDRAAPEIEMAYARMAVRMEQNHMDRLQRELERLIDVAGSGRST